MSKQQKEIVSVAIKEFIEVFYKSGVTNDFTIIKSLASILLLMDKNAIMIRENFSNETPYVVVKINLANIDKRLGLFDQWNRNNIQNKALVALISDSDPTTQLCWQNIKSMSNWVTSPISILHSFELISENENGERYYLSVLDLAISLLSSKPLTGQYTQPFEFAQLASRMIEAKGKSVFNPFSGTMSYATALAGYYKYIGIELNSEICELSKFRIQLAHLADKTDCVMGDVRSWPDRIFDIIVSTPPVGMNLTLDGENRPIKSDLVCLKNFERTTSSNGVLFTFVLPSVLYDSSRVSKEIRKYLTEHNYLDAVIELPTNLLHPYTSISLVALMLKKDRGLNEPIKMIDASYLFNGDKRKRKLDVEAVLRCLQNMSSKECVRITTDDIRKCGYIWSVSKYLHAHTESYPEGYEVMTLEKVVDFIGGERAFKDKKGHLAKISSLASEGADCIRTVDSFEESEELSNATKITEPVILLSSIRELKPTYCEASPESPIFLSPHVWACKIKGSWISPTYLCLELSKRLVKPVGVFIPRINRTEVLGMKIAFPSIENQRSYEEQNNLYKEAAESLKLAKAKELGLQSVIDTMKAEYINIVRTRKHDMMPYMRELGSVSRSLRGYVDKYGSEVLQSKVASLLTQFESAYKGLSALIEIFSQEEEYGVPERVNIDKYLVDFIGNLYDEHSGFSVDYYCDDNALRAYGLQVSPKAAALYVDIAPLDLDRIVRNITDNAIEHGFTDPERKDYQINIILSIVPEKDMFQIDFSNNGSPLPKGMDKEKYGLLGEKAGKTGKTGQGGYIVKSIIEHYHGDYDVFMEGENTVVRILLPISKTNE